MHLSSVDLAGAVGADHRHHLALGDAHRDAEQRLEVAVVGVERAHLQQRIRHRRRSPLFDAHVDFADLRAADHLGRIALGDQRAAVQHHQAVDHGDQRVDDVLDPDDRDAGRAHVVDEIDQRRGLVLDQAAGDLVEQQHARAGGERAGEFQALAVEQRQAAGAAVGLVGEPAALEQPGAAGIDVALAPAAAEGRGDHEVLEHGHAAERLRNLERARQPHAAAMLGLHAGDVVAVEHDTAGVGRDRAGDRCRTAWSCRRRSAR